MTTLSVIIPVYNSEQYLPDCIDSILMQSVTDFELILVDDGSSDNSLLICQSYANSHSNVYALSQSNAGTSAARNAGLKAATGDYITFVDNDDFILRSDAFSDLFEKIRETNADLIMYECLLYDDKLGTLSSSSSIMDLDKTISSLDKLDAVLLMAKHDLLYSAVWAKTVRRSIVIENGIWFPFGKRNEDTYWSSRVLQYSNSIAWCSKPIYAYRKNHEYAQTSKPIKLSHVRDLHLICLSRIRDVQTSALSEREKKAIYVFLAYPFTVFLGQSALFSNEILQRYNLYDAIDQLKWLLECSPHPTVKRAYFLSRIIGIHKTRRLLGFALRKKYPGIVGEE